MGSVFCSGRSTGTSCPHAGRVRPQPARPGPTAHDPARLPLAPMAAPGGARRWPLLLLLFGEKPGWGLRAQGLRGEGSGRCEALRGPRGMWGGVRGGGLLGGRELRGCGRAGPGDSRRVVPRRPRRLRGEGSVQVPRSGRRREGPARPSGARPRVVGSVGSDLVVFERRGSRPYLGARVAPEGCVRLQLETRDRVGLGFRPTRMSAQENRPGGDPGL